MLNQAALRSSGFSEFLSESGSNGWVGATILIVGIFIAVVIHALVFSFLRKTAQRVNADTWIEIIERSRSVARLALIVIFIELLLPLTYLPAGLAAFLDIVVTLVLIAIFGWFVYQVMSALMNYSMSKHRVDVEDNLEARKMRTRLRVLRQAMAMIIAFVTMASMLMVIPGAKNIGVSLFASAGVAGIVVGFAARPVLSNLLAGIQIALTQPIRIDDAVVIEGEWGWIEEITSTYVVVKIWDWRRLIVPLSQVIEKPFQNWTRETASIIGTVTWHTDYRLPVDAMREKLVELLEASPHWDGKVQVLQVIESGTETMTLRALMSAKNSPTAWDLRCEVREKMITWLQATYPQSLPVRRAELNIQGEQQSLS